MPIYEYRCAKCGDFEQMQKMSDPALQRCPKCRRKVTKLISNTSFQLKGSGWYATDYAKKSSTSTDSKASESSEKSEKSEKSDTSEKKTEKSEKKADKKDSRSKDSSSSKPSAAA